MKLPRSLTLMDTVVKANERGLLHCDGRVVGWLAPGRLRRLRLWSQWEVEIIAPEERFRPWSADLRDVIPADEALDVQVPAAHIALVEIDAQIVEVLPSGRYWVWTRGQAVQHHLYDMRAELAELPAHHAAHLPERLLRRFIVPEQQVGVLRVDGRFSRVLCPGKHLVWTYERTLDLEVFPFDEGAAPLTPELVALLPEALYTPLVVGAEQVAVLWMEERPLRMLPPGHYALWAAQRRVRAALYPADLEASVPQDCWSLFSAKALLTCTVQAYERGVLFVDGVIRDVLAPGRYAFHLRQHSVEVRLVDLRDQEVTIAGQELMTADKVTLRLNLLVKFRISDPRRSVEGVVSLRDAIYSESQLAARAHIVALTLDALLSERVACAAAMQAEVAAACAGWGVEVQRVEIKDIILPGEMKTLLNQVIEAEKQAAAQIILRREETAATRSLANTAKVLENNPMLARLKELATLKEIASEVQSLTVVLGQDEVLERLRLRT